MRSRSGAIVGYEGAALGEHGEARGADGGASEGSWAPGPHPVQAGGPVPAEREVVPRR